MILSILGLVSCHNDKEEDVSFDTSVLIGEWYNNSNGVIIDLTLTKAFLSGIVYNNIDSEFEKYEDWSGYWGYTSSTGVLSMIILHTATGMEFSSHFKLLSSDMYSLKLRDQELGSTEIYNKIVESKNLSVGTVYDINYIKANSISASGYNSTNPTIVSVDSNGHVTANKAGVAFISITTNVGTLIVKVEVT